MYVPTLPARRSYKYDDPPIIFRDVDVSDQLISVSPSFLNLIVTSIFLLSPGHGRPAEGGGDGGDAAQSPAAGVPEGAGHLSAVGGGRLGHRRRAH